MGIAALFILHVWTDYDYWKLIVSYLRVVNIMDVYPVGSDMFTSSPNVLGGGRKVLWPTEWPVAVVRVGPRPLGITIPLPERHNDVTGNPMSTSSLNK